MDDSFLERRKLLNSVLAVTAVSTQFVTILLATMPPEPKAVWNDAEIGKLVDFLLEHRAEGEGGNFKDPSFKAAAAHIASELTSGPSKTLKHCKTKWGAVSVWPSQYDRKLMACYQYTAQDNISRDCGI